MPTLLVCHHHRLSFFHWSSSFQLVPSKPIRNFFSSLSSPAKTLNPNTPFYNFLTNSLKFSETKALPISNRFSSRWDTSPEKPQSVNSFLREHGFSETQIRSAVSGKPQILFADINKILRPKVEFFQQLGLVGSDLGKFISNHTTLLTASLERKLVPCVEVLKEILGNDENSGEDLIRVMNRCHWLVTRYPRARLLVNIALLESCGIVGTQLSKLLKRQPWVFAMSKSTLRSLVYRVLDMGLSVDSGMFVRALESLSSLSNETFRKKLDLFRSLGFSEDECLEIFRRMPVLFKTSEEKLKFGINFFLNTVKMEKSTLVRHPTCLLYSMEKRVIPRYNVLQLIKLKKLMDKESSLCHAVNITEQKFLEKFVYRFGDDDAEQLLVAYEGRLLYSNEEDE